MIQSSQENSNINGLYYQNDIESKHAAEKRDQHFKKKSILATVSILYEMIKREGTTKFGQYMVHEIMFYPVGIKTFKFKVMFGTPAIRIVKEIVLINSGNKFKSFESSVIGKNFNEIFSTVYQLKVKK